MTDVVRQTIRNDGFRGLYRGLNVAIWNPKVAVRFGAFEQLRKLVGDSEGKVSKPGLLFCGTMAGLCEAVLAVTPVESIKVKFIDDMNYLTNSSSKVDLILLQKKSLWCDADCDGARCWILLLAVRTYYYHSNTSWMTAESKAVYREV